MPYFTGDTQKPEIRRTVVLTENRMPVQNQLSQQLGDSKKQREHRAEAYDLMLFRKREYEEDWLPRAEALGKEVEDLQAEAEILGAQLIEAGVTADELQKIVVGRVKAMVEAKKAMKAWSRKW